MSHLSSAAEWDEYSSFTTFLSSPELRSFAGTFKPFLTGPAKPLLYETDRGPATCASAPVTEIFQLKLPAMGSESELESAEGVEAAEKVWTEFVGVVEREGEGLVRGAIGGRSLNSEGESWVGVLGWENLEVSGAVVMRCGGPWWVVVRMGGADADCVCQAWDTIRRKPELQHGLQALRDTGETSVFVVELKALGTEMV